MRLLNQWTTVANHSVLITTLLVAANCRAEDNPPRSRAGFSGQQLFEHQWQWNGPAARPSKTEIRKIRLVRSNIAGSRRDPRAMLPAFPNGDGLGPLHNATSCAECHIRGGGSDVNHNVTLITIDPRSEGLLDLKVGGQMLNELFPGVLSPQGVLAFNTLVHDRSTRDGYAPIRSQLADYVPGGIDDSWFNPLWRDSAAIAERPVVAGRHRSIDFYLSQRNSPALFGLGALESINVRRLRGIAHQQAVKTNGKVTGRVAGKFGWRGQVETLSQFVSGACGSELGLTQLVSSQADDPADPHYENFGHDMTSEELTALTAYVQSIPRPIERPADGHALDDVRAGEKIFRSVGCSICHTADVHPVSGLFTDLLLHDMGPDLQAPFPAPIAELNIGRGNHVNVISAPRFEAQTRTRPTTRFTYYGSSSTRNRVPAPYPIESPQQPRFPRGDVPASFDVTWDSLQREWKTPPLWGVADTGPYLHDGRAVTLDEAILWHAGEADSSRDAYKALDQTDKDLVLAFLSSLRAPEITDATDRASK